MRDTDFIARVYVARTVDDAAFGDAHNALEFDSYLWTDTMRADAVRLREFGVQRATVSQSDLWELRWDGRCVETADTCVVRRITPNGAGVIASWALIAKTAMLCVVLTRATAAREAARVELRRRIGADAVVDAVCEFVGAAVEWGRREYETSTAPCVRSHWRERRGRSPLLSYECDLRRRSVRLHPPAGSPAPQWSRRRVDEGVHRGFLVWLAMRDWILGTWASAESWEREYDVQTCTGHGYRAIVHRPSEGLICATYVDFDAVPDRVLRRYAAFPTTSISHVTTHVLQEWAPVMGPTGHIGRLNCAASRRCEFEIRKCSADRFRMWWADDIPVTKPVTYAVVRAYTARGDLPCGEVTPGMCIDLREEDKRLLLPPQYYARSVFEREDSSHGRARSDLARYVEILLPQPSSVNIAVRRMVEEGGSPVAPTVAQVLRHGRREKIWFRQTGEVTLEYIERLFAKAPQQTRV